MKQLSYRGIETDVVEFWLGEGFFCRFNADEGYFSSKHAYERGVYCKEKTLEALKENFERSVDHYLHWKETGKFKLSM